MILGENHRFLSLRKSECFDIITVHQEIPLRRWSRGYFLAVRFELLCNEKSMEKRPTQFLCGAF